MIAVLVVALSLLSPSEADKAAFCAVAQSILREAGGNIAEAKRIALRNGYSRAHIDLALRYCARS